MNQVEALQKIQQLGAPAFETRDVSALLQVTPASASVLLSRLASRGFVRRLSRGRWSIGAQPNRDQLAEQVCTEVVRPHRRAPSGVTPGRCAYAVDDERAAHVGAPVDIARRHSSGLGR